MAKAKVAIITRTKDRPLFLARAIQSVAAQTYDDYVHVIVNDGGSTAQIERIVEQSGQQGSIKLFHRETASNAPDTIFNESIDRVDSEYVAIHDDDDTWHPEFLAQTTKRLEESGMMGVVTRTDKVTEELDGNSIKTHKTEQWMPDVKVISLYRQCIDNQLTPIAFVYRRDAYQGVGKYDPGLPIVGDWDFGIRFLQKYDVEFLDPGYALAFYHHRKYVPGAQGNSSFGNSIEKHRYYANLLANKYLRQELAEGRLGIGYIMSQLRYERANTSNILKKILPGFVVGRLKKRVQN